MFSCCFPCGLLALLGISFVDGIAIRFADGICDGFAYVSAYKFCYGFPVMVAYVIFQWVLP